MAAENTGLNATDLSVILHTLYDAGQMASGCATTFTHATDVIWSVHRKILSLMNSIPVKLNVPTIDSEPDATEKRFSNII